MRVGFRWTDGMTYLDPLFFCFLAMEKCCGIFFGGERGGGGVQDCVVRWEGTGKRNIWDGKGWCQMGVSGVFFYFLFFEFFLGGGGRGWVSIYLVIDWCREMKFLFRLVEWAEISCGMGMAWDGFGEKKGRGRKSGFAWWDFFCFLFLEKGGMRGSGWMEYRVLKIWRSDGKLFPLGSPESVVRLLFITIDGLKMCCHTGY